MQPASDAIEAGHHRADDNSVYRGDEKEFRLDPQLQVDHVLGDVVHRVIRKGFGPQRDNAVAVTLCERPYGRQPRRVASAIPSLRRVTVLVCSLGHHRKGRIVAGAQMVRAGGRRSALGGWKRAAPAADEVTLTDRAGDVLVATDCPFALTAPAVARWDTVKASGNPDGTAPTSRRRRGERRSAPGAPTGRRRWAR